MARSSGDETAAWRKQHLTLIKQMDMSKCRLKIRRAFLVARSMVSESVITVKEEMDQF